MSLNLSSTPMLPLPPSISLSLPFPTASLCFPHNYVPLHTHNIPFLSHQKSEIYYPSTFFFLSPIIYALIPALIFIPHYNTWSYTVLQNSPPPTQPIPIPCPCLPPIPPFYLFITYFFCMHLNPIICICRYIIYSIE